LALTSKQGCRRTGALLPLTFKKGATGEEVPFHNSIIAKFMVHQKRLETNALQLFAHPEILEWFIIISVIIFAVNIVDEQKQA